MDLLRYEKILKNFSTKGLLTALMLSVMIFNCGLNTPFVLLKSVCIVLLYYKLEQHFLLLRYKIWIAKFSG
jgi:hypothetical protein